MVRSHLNFSSSFPYPPISASSFSGAALTSAPRAMAATTIARSAATHLSLPFPTKSSPSDPSPKATLKLFPKRRRCASVVLASLHGDANGKILGGALELEHSPFDDDASKDLHTLPSNQSMFWL